MSAGGGRVWESWALRDGGGGGSGGRGWCFCYGDWFGVNCLYHPFLNSSFLPKNPLLTDASRCAQTQVLVYGVDVALKYFVYTYVHIAITHGRLRKYAPVCQSSKET